MRQDARVGRDRYAAKETRLEIIKKVLKYGPLTTTQIQERVRMGGDSIREVLIQNPTVFELIQKREGCKPAIWKLK